jgi:GntR family transcriptional regulator/MocR family aminotransferase
MPKRTATIPLALTPRPPGATATRWLYDALRTEILEGRLRPGARLPATRDLAAQYGLSRGTVVNAFDALRSEGYVVGRVGSGTRVNAVLPEDLLQTSRAPGHQPAPLPPRARRLAGFASQVALFRGYEPRALRAFRANQPALDLFPTRRWAQVAARRMRRATTAQLLGTEPLGYRPLREVVADYLRTSRGVRCEPAQVAIVSGAQEALDLVARLVLDPGDRVCIEEPGYPGAARVFEAVGATIVSAPVDGEGVTLGRRRWRGVRLAYVTPAHQFPLGIAMSLPRRLALLEWARAAGALIFEDDYDAEYRYAGRPVPALQGLDRHGVVCFSGTFSKVLFPSLRLGYLVVPPDLVDRVAAAKSIISRHAPLLDQALLCDFIADGHFGRHIRRMREVYAARLDVLLSEGRARLGGLLEISDVEAGLQTVGWLSGGLTGIEAEQAAAERGVEVTSLSRYARAPLLREGLQLGFAAVDAAEIRRGARELEVALSHEAGSVRVTEHDSSSAAALGSRGPPPPTHARRRG